MHFTWEQGRIPGAYYLDRYYYEFNEVRLAEIVGKTQEVVIYGRSGDDRGAAEAAARAVTWGYENVYFFRDGLDKWKAAGYPMDTGKQK